MSEPVVWSGETPTSRRFGDIYFSPQDGLAETRSVFLQGCGLPSAWSGRRSFVVAETGFGSGLNVLALIHLWRANRPSPDAVLNIFSLEAFPLSGEDAARALVAFPDLTDLAKPLHSAWPRGRSGFHRVEWPDLGVILDLAVMDVATALKAWSGFADAWFLDGFAPSKNPDMWRPEVLALVAERSRPGARVASFTVAGAVRRGLEAQGFSVYRAAGFGAKRQRLEGVLADTSRATPSRAAPRRVAVIGAGIAGAALMRAFHRLGVSAEVFDAEGAAAGASGNPSALVTPRLDAGFGPAARLSAQAFARSTQIYEDEVGDAILARGVVQAARQEKDPQRFAAIAMWEGFDPGALTPLSAEAVAGLLDEPRTDGGLMMADALVVEPERLAAAWITRLVRRRIAGLSSTPDGWRLMDAEGADAGVFDVVVLAAGPALSDFVGGLNLRPIRGQVSLAPGVKAQGLASAWGDYAAPARSGVLFGATHQRDDADASVRREDDVRNLAALAAVRPRLAARIDPAFIVGRAGVRAATPDHLPLAGPIPDPDGGAHRGGLYVLAGLGGRGFTLAPLLAEHVAALAVGVPSPLPRDLGECLDPGRFARRRAPLAPARPRADGMV